MDIPVTKIRWRDYRLLTAEAVLVIPAATLPEGNCWLPTAEQSWGYVASTTHHPGTIFPTYPLGSGHQPQAVFPWHNSEGRHWAKSLLQSTGIGKQQCIATSLHLFEHGVGEQTAHTDNQLKHICFLMNTNVNMKHQRLEVSLSPRTSTLIKSTKAGNIVATLILCADLHCAQLTEGWPSFSIQTGAGQQKLQKNCLPVHKFNFFFFYCNTYLNIYLYILEQGRDMRWRSREDKFKKQSHLSASKKLVAQITSLARVISHFKHGWLPAGFKRADYLLMI